MARGSIRTNLILLLALAVAGLAGCAKSVKPPPKHVNQPPQAALTYAPLPGDTSSFRVHFYWSGWDNDGEVVRFRYAVDADTAKTPDQWIATTAKDTTLLFLVDPIKEIQGHVFWVRAEDNDGAFSAPAKRFFSAKTLPPTSRIERGPSGLGTLIGPNFTFEWSGIDPDGGETGGSAPVDSFEYLLLQVRGIADTLVPPTHDPLPDYSEAVYLKLINDATGRSLLNYGPPPPLSLGNHDDWKWQGVRGLRKRFKNVTPAPYVFAVRAVDIAGATEKNLTIPKNIRYFNVTNRNPGPTLVIRSSVLNTALPAASGPEDIVRKQIQIFEGETISFSWTASAEIYGGEVVGYTFALDDTTTADWASLTINKTGATFQPSLLPPGAHFLYVRVVDDGGLVTNAKIPLFIVHPRFKDADAPRLALWVDDFGSPGGLPLNASPNYPADSPTEDNWVQDIVTTPLAQEFNVAFDYYDTIRSQGEVLNARGVPKPDYLKDFRTVIWYVDLNNSISSPTALWSTLVGGNYSELSGYLRAGGTLILTGFELGFNTAKPSTTPYASFSRGMCATLQAGTDAFDLSYFPRTVMGVDGAISGLNSALRSQGARDFVEARPTAAGTALGFQLAAVDTGVGHKWDPYVFPGTNLDQKLAPGLPAVDGWKMQEFFGCIATQKLYRREDENSPIAQAIYAYHGVPQGVAFDKGPSPREGLYCGIATQAHDLANGDGSPITPSNSKGAFGRMVFLGFPIYYIKDPQAIQVMRAAFAYVNASPTLPQ
ncbi:MAG: hypothetical protein ACM3JJ_08915 [Hyphomicrobiales bacterium]